MKHNEFSDKLNKKNARTVAKIYASTALIGGIYFAVIKLFHITLPCLFYTITNKLCPGCGLTRMCIALLRFDFKSAFAYNQGAFILAFSWLVISLLCCFKKTSRFFTHNTLYGFLTGSITVMIIFGICRNL